MVWILVTAGIIFILAGFALTCGGIDIGWPAIAMGVIIMIVGVVLVVTGSYQSAQNFRESCESAGGYMLGDSCYGFRT